MVGHDYDRFRVDDGTEVLALLRESVRARVLCSVRAAGRPETYLSPMRVLADDGETAFDAPRAPVIERALVPGSLASIELRLHECRVGFESRVAAVAADDGRPMLRLARPEALMRLHKRETFRVQVPDTVSLRLTLDGSDPALVDVPVQELSIQGASLSVTGARARFGSGKVFERARLSLPDGRGWTLSVRVVHTGVVRRAAEGGEMRVGEMRVGVQFVQGEAGFETAVAQIVGGIARSAASATRA